VLPALPVPEGLVALFAAMSDVFVPSTWTRSNSWS
jgi:hypothetical protein